MYQCYKPLWNCPPMSIKGWLVILAIIVIGGIVKLLFERS